MRAHLMVSGFLLLNGLSAQVSIGVVNGGGPVIGISSRGPDSFVRPLIYDQCEGNSGEKYAVTLKDKSIFFRRTGDKSMNWIDSNVVFSIRSVTSTMVCNSRVDTKPVIACDLSKGENKGRIYIAWSDMKNGKNNLDVFLVYSDDQGKNWTEPLLVTYRPNHRHQFRPELAVDPMNGMVYLLYADQQNFIGSNKSELSLAVSTNGGLKFDHYILPQSPFSALSSLNMGFRQTENGIAAWWKLKGTEGVYTLSPANLRSLSEQKEACVSFEKTVYTFSNVISIEFEVREQTRVSAEINKPLDANFHKLVFTGKNFDKGKCTIRLMPAELSISEDNYILSLYAGGQNYFVWINSEDK